MNREAAKQWLYSAKLDLSGIQKLADDPALTPLLCFHAQQAVEKSLKALLEYHKGNVPRVHPVKSSRFYFTGQVQALQFSI